MDISVPALYRSIMTDLAFSHYDKNYVLKRLAAEGMKFLTVELPKISAAVLRGLEGGSFDRTELTSFSFKGSTLRFMEKLLNEIFCSKSGMLLSVPSGNAIAAVRQLCEYTYKLGIPNSKDIEKKAISSFINNEEELEKVGNDPEVIGFANQLRKDFETYYPEISRVDIIGILSEFRPRATAGTFVGSDELYFIEKISTSASTRPVFSKALDGFYKPYPGAKFGPKKVEGVYSSSTCSVKPVYEPNHSELLLVPKDSRGPRTICRETLKRVETQMAFFDYMVDKLPKISNGAINFRDQLVNRQIAEKSSVTKEYATLDLKDASDRVSYKVVRKIFENSPGLSWFLKGSRRATHVSLDKVVHLIGARAPLRLSKLAGMGSGLTFPTMSLLISLAICRIVKTKFSNLSYEYIRSCVFVYGDDICVPSKWAADSAIALAKIGLKVNTKKSFVHGNFRESCGGDYYAGVDVTPTRMKLSNSKAVVLTPGRIELANNANAMKQLYEHSKELFKKGFFKTARYIVSVCDRAYSVLFNCDMPCGAFDSECSYLVNYTKGTGHLDVDQSTKMITIRPERIGNLDNHKIVSKNGRSFTLDVHKGLSSKLSTVDRGKAGASESAIQKMTMDRLKPTASLAFGEVTTPRTLTFAKADVPNTFLINPISHDRDRWLEKHRSEKTVYGMACVIYYATCHRAFF